MFEQRFWHFQNHFSPSAFLESWKCFIPRRDSAKQNPMGSIWQFFHFVFKKRFWHFQNPNFQAAFLKWLDLSLTEIPPPSDPYYRAVILMNFFRIFNKIFESFIFTTLHQISNTKKIMYTTIHDLLDFQKDRVNLFRRNPEVIPLRLKTKICICTQSKKEKIQGNLIAFA